MIVSINDALHLAVIAFGLGSCSIILAHLNAVKAERKRACKSVCLLDDHSSTYARLVLPAHYVILLSGYAGSVLFDYHAPTSLSWAYTTLLAYVIGYAASLLDFSVSHVESMPVMEILPGMALWCSSSLAVGWFQQHLYGSNSVTVVNPRDLLSLQFLGWQYVTFLVNLLCRGFFTDLFFSPLHRYMHAASHYQTQHKKHHAYVRNLTNLVLYYGTLVDDFLMPLTTILGGLLSLLLEEATDRTGLLNPSNLVTTMILTQLPYSHASDRRLASLFCPLPKSLNFIDYHLQHHLEPQSNFGLLVITDMIWDAILGTTTVTASHPKTERVGKVKMS